MVDFNLIKGKIQNFSRTSLIKHCLSLLIEVQRSADRNFAFWNLLILLKWSLLHSRDSSLRAEARRQDILDTLLLMENFESSRRVVDFKRGIERAMRIIAYQQLWFQNRVTNEVFDRQLTMYCQVPGRFDLNAEFARLTNLTIKEFINLCYWTFLYLNRYQTNEWTYGGILYSDYFELLRNKYGTEKPKTFINLLTLNNSDEVKSLQKMNDEGYQLYETSFWSMKPFLRLGKDFITPHI